MTQWYIYLPRNPWSFEKFGPFENELMLKAYRGNREAKHEIKERSIPNWNIIWEKLKVCPKGWNCKKYPYFLKELFPDTGYFEVEPVKPSERIERTPKTMRRIPSYPTNTPSHTNSFMDSVYSPHRTAEEIEHRLIGNVLEEEDDDLPPLIPVSKKNWRKTMGGKRSKKASKRTRRRRAW